MRIMTGSRQLAECICASSGSCTGGHGGQVGRVALAELFRLLGSVDQASCALGRFVRTWAEPVTDCAHCLSPSSAVIYVCDLHRIVSFASVSAALRPDLARNCTATLEDGKKGRGGPGEETHQLSHEGALERKFLLMGILLAHDCFISAVSLCPLPAWSASRAGWVSRARPGVAAAAQAVQSTASTMLPSSEEDTGARAPARLGGTASECRSALIRISACAHTSIKQNT